MNTFAENLIRMRKRASFTQEDFANMIGVSIDTVRRWEGEKQEPRLGDLKRISKILNISIADLVNEDNEQKELTESSTHETQKSSMTINSENNALQTIKKKTRKNQPIIIQHGNTRVEIPATKEGYSILREKLKEVNLDLTYSFAEN